MSPRRAPRPETVTHIIQIENWEIDYSFGIDVTSDPVKYSDTRHLVLEGPIIEPARITAKRGKILCFPQAALVGLERPWVNPTKKESPNVGLVYYRGKDYTASLTFPGDMLPMILQMLLAGKYRHIRFEASKGGPEVFQFTFTDIDADPDSKLSFLPR